MASLMGILFAIYLEVILELVILSLMKPLLARELNVSRRTARIVRSLHRRMDATCTGIKEDGRSNTFLRGVTNLKKP